MGFQDMRKVVHEAASRKGGKVRIKKGLAKLSPERRREIASQGGKVHADRSKVHKKQDQDRSQHSPNLADVLGDIRNIDDIHN